MRRGFVVLGCLSLMAALFFASPATADRASPTPAELDRAAELFKKGKALQAAGKIADAYATYQQAWALHESPDIAANLAAAELAIGKSAAAAEHFRFALRHLLAGTTAEQKAKLEEGLEKAKQDAAMVHLVLRPNRAELQIDGSSAGKGPFQDELFIEPGEHRFTASAPGFVSRSETLWAKKGETHSIIIELEAEKKTAAGSGVPTDPHSKSPASPKVPPDKPRTTEPSPLPAYIALGVGIAGLGAGVGFLVAAANKDAKRDDLLAEIPGSNECGPGTTAKDQCAEVSSLADDAKRFRTLGYVNFGAALAGGVLTYFLWPRSPEATNAAVVVPSFGWYTTALQVQGRF